MLSYFTKGSGKPYIWLHGLLGNGLNLTPLSNAIAGQHYFLDARNHGKSFHAHGMSYSTQANDVLRFMDNNSIEKANFIGHSMRRKSAMFLSCTHPNRVEKLCIMDIAPFNYIEVMDKYYKNIREYLEFIRSTDITNKTRKEIEELCQNAFNDIKITQLISTNLKGTDKNYAWRIGIQHIIDGIDELGSWEEVNTKFNGPALALVGENSVHTVKSSLIPPGKKLIDVYLEYFSNVEIDVISKTGHFVHVENPSEVKESLSKFFNN